MIQIVTGDDIAIPVTLTKDGKLFSIASNAVVKAALVGADHSAILAGPVTLSNTATGANWPASLVVVEIPGTLTAAITAFKPALLEIQVNDGGPLTWFAEVRIIKGLIE